jgi:predicted CXXCH cytochrome family protein
MLCFVGRYALRAEMIVRIARKTDGAHAASFAPNDGGSSLQVGTVRNRHAGIIKLAASFFVFLVSLAPLASKHAHAVDKKSTPVVGNNNSGYVGSAVCASCHAGIYGEYKMTAMGRSVVPVDSGTISKLSLPAHFTNEAIHRSFDVYEKDGGLYQSEYALTPEGSEVFRDTRAIRWLIGAGENGYGPVVENDHYIFQAPLSFYTKPDTWGPSPGYETLDLGFNRPILSGCITCHAGRANAVPNANGQYGDPPFSEAAIGCEECHGPGAAHIQTMKSRTNKNGPTKIVNPARLSPYMADNICMACHQTGDVRVLKPGKSYSDIRPGQPLDSVLSIFLVPPTPEAPPSADHVEHYYSMILSKCYRFSAGRMSCLSCHDPHVQPARNEVPAYYNRKCLACHTNTSCKLSLTERQNQSPPNNCVGCQMPKRDIQVISHSTATNHRIVATPDEPFPDAAFHQTKPALPDLIHLNPAPGQEKTSPPQLTLLQAYGELAASKPQYTGRYLEALAKLEKSTPDNALVQSAAGRRDLKSGDFSSAITHLQRAVEIGPPAATTCADLAEALAHEGHKQEAVVWLDKSIELDPFNPFTQRSLVVQLIDLKEYARALAALEHYVQVFPQDIFMRQMLEKARAQPVQ